MAKSKDTLSSTEIKSAITAVCQAQFGVLDSAFLCRSVSVLNPKDPLCVQQTVSIEDVIGILTKNKIGCVLICDETKKMTGIFTERDLLLKVVGALKPVDWKRSIQEVMTPNPMGIEPDETIAFALNLMSHGGFRHLPLIDKDGFPIGVISVKDVIDYIVNKMTDDLLNIDIK